MKRRRVKITGIGPVTPAGIGIKMFETQILEPISRIRPFTALDPSLGEFVAAYIENFEVEDYIQSPTLPKGSARHTLFAVAGSALALKDAGISKEDLTGSNCVVVVGACVMDFDGIGRTIESVVTKGVRGALGRTVYSTNGACIAASVAQTLGIDARTISVQSACCTGVDAIGYAARLVASGEAEIAICGGTDAPLYRCPLVELRSIGMTPSTTQEVGRINRPFDLWRTTGVVSEGACIFVVEPEDSTRAGYTFVDGYAYANDFGEDLCGGMAVAMKHALADAGVRPEQVELINAWGPGHKLIDKGEARALDKVFGNRLRHIPAVSIKGAVGNALGAAGAMQVAAAALGLRSGLVPPTGNWEYPDPSCPLNLKRSSRSVSHSNVLVNAHGLSGVNASLVLTR